MKTPESQVYKEIAIGNLISGAIHQAKNYSFFVFNFPIKKLPADKKNCGLILSRIFSAQIFWYG